MVAAIAKEFDYCFFVVSITLIYFSGIWLTREQSKIISKEAIVFTTIGDFTAFSIVL